MSYLHPNYFLKYFLFKNILKWFSFTFKILFLTLTY
jgi:hypothetical protein